METCVLVIYGHYEDISVDFSVDSSHSRTFLEKTFAHKKINARAARV